MCSCYDCPIRSQIKPDAHAGAATRFNWRILARLIPLYLLAVGLHVAALWEGARFPHLSTDEAQYTMVGENLRLGKGYTIRGRMHAGIPPLYPLWVAAVSTVASPSRHSILCANSAAVCLVMFPAFLLARWFRISVGNAYLMALAAAYLPHTFYAALCMAESLQYPLLLGAFYVAARWLETPSRERDVQLGLLLGAALLNKLAALSFIVALLLTVLILGRRPGTKGTPRRAPHALLVFGIAIGLDLAWILWKLLHGASALGHYGTVLAESGTAPLSPRLLAAYLGDFFIAPGLIVVVPLLYWFRENWRTRHSTAVWLAMTLACQISIHGVLEARLTGILRERLFLYSFPLMAIAAVAGLQNLRKPSSLWLRAAAPYAALLLLIPIALYTFATPPSPAVEVPWAGLLGALTPHGFEEFSNPRLLRYAILAMVLAASALALAPARNKATALAAMVLLFYVAAFFFSARILGDWSRIGVAAVQPMVSWLAVSGVQGGSRLGIAGGPWEFEDRSTFRPSDQFFQEWVHARGPNKLLSVQLEALARYDVRMITGRENIGSALRPGDFFLVDSRFSRMDLVAESYPYYLYRAPARFNGTPEPVYTVDIPPEGFLVPLAGRRPDGGIVGTGSGLSGILAITPGAPFVPGRYRLLPQLETRAGERLALAVNMAGSELARTEMAEARPLEVEIGSEQPVQFAVHGKSVPEFLFTGLTVEFLAAPPAAPVQMLPPVTAAFAEESAALSAAARPIHVLCSFDNINNLGLGPEDGVRKADGLHLFGWAFDPQSETAEPVRVELVSETNRAYFVTASRNARRDVAAAFHAPANSGFTVHAGLDPIPPGRYRLYLTELEHGGPVDCQNYRNVVIE